MKIRAGLFAAFIFACTFEGVQFLSAAEERQGAGLSEGEVPLIAMLVPNGRPSHGELGEFLAGLRRGGYEQFLIYARSGCETPYLSDEWFGNCEYMIRRGSELGYTSVWLYDEFNWPSGTADKRVMKVNPDYELKYLAANKNAAGKVEFALRRNPQMADLLNPDCTDCFIRLTHEEYYKRLGKYFGGVVKGIFSDEPSISYFDKSINDAVRIPWYDGLEADYLKNTGRNLRSDIERDFGSENPVWQEEVSRLLSRRFADSYIKRISDWCSSHGVLSTGHLLAEVNTRAAARSNGWLPGPLCGFTFPGMDEIDTHTNFDKMEWLTFASVMYAADKRGNKGALAELFALGPVDMPLSKMRSQIWLAAAHGVNRYVTAINQLDLRIKISDDPYHLDAFASWLSSLTPNQPYFEDFNILAKDSKRAAAYAVAGRDIEIGVRYPYAVAPVEKILRELAKRQIQYRLLSESDSAAGLKFVANPVGREIFEETTGKKFSSAEDFASWLEANYTPRDLFLEADGRRAKNIFVRSYKGGETLAINFGAQERDLSLVRSGGKKYRVRLAPFGVEVFPSKPSAATAHAERLDYSLSAPWRVELDKPNTLHADFKDGEFRFHLESPMALAFALRDFCGAKSLKLDGKELALSKPCSVLPQGFSNLYAQTKEVLLPEGEHVLQIDKSVQEFAYMPICLITGRFSNNGISKIYPYNLDGKGLYGYAGKIAQSAKIKIPAGAKILRADTGNIVSELFIDGKSLGSRAWYPFEWDISEYAGREAEVKLVRKPSFGGLFGKKLAHKKFASAWANGVFRAFKPSNEKPFSPVAEIEFLPR